MTHCKINFYFMEPTTLVKIVHHERFFAVVDTLKIV